MGEGDGEMVDYSLQIERDIKEENKVIEVNDIGGKGEDPLFTQEIDYSELDELNIEPLADHFLNDSRKKESGLYFIFNFIFFFILSSLFYFSLSPLRIFPSHLFYSYYSIHIIIIIIIAQY